MKRSTLIWLIVAASATLVGSMIFVGAMSAMSWDFKKLSNTKYETNEYQISEDFSAISIDTDTADVELVLTDAPNASVVCCEEENMKHSVEVKDSTLIIKVVNTKKWHDYIGIVNIGSGKITVYLPKSEYGALNVEATTGVLHIPSDFSFESIDVSLTTGGVTNKASCSGGVRIKTTTGSITVDSASAQTLDLTLTTGKATLSRIACEGGISVKVTTGKTYIKDVTCKTLSSSGNTGDIVMKNVIAEQSLTINRSTGDVEFENCDAGEIFIETDTGDVEGSLLSEKVFIVTTDTGDIEVPKSTAGGICEITTDTGDVEIDIKG